MKFAGTAPRGGATPVDTHNTAPGFKPPPHLELAFTAACTLTGEGTFYEDAEQRNARLVHLAHETTRRDPARAAATIASIRQDYGIRSASIVLAAEYVRSGGPHGRAVVDSVLQRGDEPAEMIGYWHATHGRSLPAAVKRGVADAVTRLYTERNVIKYDSTRRALRMADVVELVRPRPADAAQSALFRWLLDNRHHGPVPARFWDLPMLHAHAMLAHVQPEQRRAVLREQGLDALARGGFTWERLSSWLPGGMDAEAWEAVIPRMGVMALLRNLRNFDQAHISEAAIDRVIEKITSAEDVKASGIWPLHVWAAYREAPSDAWKRALGQTFARACANVPQLDNTLFAIDLSGSMTAPLSSRGTISRAEVAAVMGVAVASRGRGSQIVAFANGAAFYDPTLGVAPLQQVQEIAEFNGGRLGSNPGYGYRGSLLGHDTRGHQAIITAWEQRGPFERVVMFTDDQQSDSHLDISFVPLMVTFGLGGYQPVSTWGRGRMHVSGYADATFEALTKLV